MVRLPLVATCLLSLSSAARGEIVVDHPPRNFGGFASDTEFLDDFGFPLWQRVADDFVLGSDATIRQIQFFGFYHLDNPPSSETFRIRFYGSRAHDGLPDDANIISEQVFSDPLREWTGRIVFTGVGPREYSFALDLAVPVLLAQDVPYWLEIVQMGDPSTRFRWEQSEADLNGLAAINPIVPDWQSSSPAITDAAFQLNTVPEPASALLVLLAGALGRSICRRKEMMPME